MHTPTQTTKNRGWVNVIVHPIPLKNLGMHETVGHFGNVRIVRPQVNGEGKTHYNFDTYGHYWGGELLK